MKPAWDKLMKAYKDSKTALVADVDCTAEGKDLCETHGVEGFPTIKWGDPSGLEAYEGGRDFKELKKFADENLKPLCSPVNIDLCDEAKKKQIGELQALSAADLTAKIEKIEADIKEVSDNFDKEVEKLQKTYEDLEKDKGEKTKAAKDKGLGLMKAVLATRSSSKEDL